MQQQTTKRFPWAAMWRGLVELDFLSNFFTWLMELLARVTEPLASLSAIYIIVVAGVPALESARLHPLALALIIGSPELVVVGAFKIASREVERGNKKGWWLLLSCFVLLSLTALTIADQFMWHWSADAVNALMGCRCLAGIGYSFARGIVTSGSEPVFTTRSVNDVVNELTARFTVNLQETVNLIREQTHVEMNRLAEEMQQHRNQLLAEVNRVNGAVHSELSRVLTEQGQAWFTEVIDRLEHVHSERLQAVYSHLERVTVSLESQPVAQSRASLRLPTRSVNRASEPCQPSESKVEQGRRFAVHHYHAHGSLPTLAMIMAQVACSKALASRVVNLARQDVGSTITVND